MVIIFHLFYLKKKFSLYILIKFTKAQRNQNAQEKRYKN